MKYLPVLWRLSLKIIWSHRILSLLRNNIPLFPGYKIQLFRKKNFTRQLMKTQFMESEVKSTSFSKNTVATVDEWWMIADKLKCHFSETKSLAYKEKNPWLPRKQISGLNPWLPRKKNSHSKNEKSIFFFFKCGSAIQMSDKLIKFQKNLNKIRNTQPLYSVQTVEKKKWYPPSAVPPSDPRVVLLSTVCLFTLYFLKMHVEHYVCSQYTINNPSVQQS